MDRGHVTDILTPGFLAKPLETQRSRRLCCTTRMAAYTLSALKRQMRPYSPKLPTKVLCSSNGEPTLAKRGRYTNSVLSRFKLHLRPSSLADSGNTDMQLKPLPKGKTAVDVFADVLKYLLACTKTFIQESHANGESLWNSVASTYEVILTHPNGWGGSQQTKMRDAALRAKLIPDTTAGAQRLHFLTEGEASMNYCVSLGMPEIGVKASHHRLLRYLI